MRPTKIWIFHTENDDAILKTGITPTLPSPPPPAAYVGTQAIPHHNLVYSDVPLEMAHGYAQQPMVCHAGDQPTANGTYTSNLKQWKQSAQI